MLSKLFDNFVSVSFANKPAIIFSGEYTIVFIDIFSFY